MSFCSSVEDILSWKNKTTSLCLLLSINLLYFLLFIIGKSVLSVFCYLSAFILATGLFVRICGGSTCCPVASGGGSATIASSLSTTPTSTQSTGDASLHCSQETLDSLTGDRGTQGTTTCGTTTCFFTSLWSGTAFTPPTPTSKLEIVSYETVESNMLYTYDLTNSVASYARDLLLWKDIALSTRMSVALAGMGYICSWFSFAQITFLCIWVLMCGTFVRDLLYLQYIQPVLEPRMKQAVQGVRQVVSRIPRMKELQKTE